MCIKMCQVLLDEQQQYILMHWLLSCHCPAKLSGPRSLQTILFGPHATLGDIQQKQLHIQFHCFFLQQHSSEVSTHRIELDSPYHCGVGRCNNGQKLTNTLHIHIYIYPKWTKVFAHTYTYAYYSQAFVEFENCIVYTCILSLSFACVLQEFQKIFSNYTFSRCWILIIIR